MKPSQPDRAAVPPTPEALHTALCRWHDAVRAVDALARRQLAAIDAAGAEGGEGIEPLTDLLREKDGAYRAAVSLSEAASALRDRLEALGSPGRDTAVWALIERERAGIAADLAALADVEARSEERLNARVNAVRGELDRLRRGRSMAVAYAPAGSASPRFLDQRR